MKAFKIYSKLSSNGKCGEEWHHEYTSSDEIRNLVDNFAREQDCIVIVAGYELYLIPSAKGSEYHVSNEYIKSKYLKDKSTNGDLYLMYVAIIVLIGEFYDSNRYFSTSREYIRIEEWMNKVSAGINVLKSINPEELKVYELEYKYNWTTIIDKWDALNDISETAKVQDARGNTRYAFLNSTKKFLIDMELLYEEVGCLYLTDKTKVIVQMYFMEEERNRDILEFIHGFRGKEKK